MHAENVNLVLLSNIQVGRWVKVAAVGVLVVEVWMVAVVEQGQRQQRQQRQQ